MPNRISKPERIPFFDAELKRRWVQEGHEASHRALYTHTPEGHDAMHRNDQAHYLRAAAAAYRRWRAEEIRRGEYRRPKPSAAAALPDTLKASKRRVPNYHPRQVPDWLRRAVEKATAEKSEEP